MDDEEYNISVLKYFLNSIGNFKIYQCFGGDEAVDFIKNNY